MQTHSKMRILTSVVAATLFLAFSLPADAAPRRGGGGGGHGGGGARPQANHAKADSRSRDVRSTSVNNVSSRKNVNVNANKNVNVNVNADRHDGCCGWDDDFHPVATAAAVTATAAIVGSIVRSVPPNCVPVSYGGMMYQQCGSSWYQPQGSQYIVVNAPY